MSTPAVPPAMRRHVRACRTCNAAILWTVTEAGKRLAVDPKPNEEGNQAVYRDGAGTFRSRVPTAELPAAPYEQRHMPHVATCRGASADELAARQAGIEAGQVVDFAAARKRRTRR